MEETKKKLYVERDGFWTEAAMLFIALAMVFRLIGSIGRWDDMHYMVTQVALPIFGGLLFLLCLLLFGKRAFWTTVVPVVIGVVFFIFRVMGLDSEWEKVGWIAFYVVIAVFYTMSFAHTGLKWALAALLFLIFAYHVGIRDLPRLMDMENPVSFVDGMEEMSILSTILSMLSVSFAMKTAAKAGAKEEPPAEPEAEEPPAEPEAEEPPAEPEKKLSRRERREQKRREKEEKLQAKPEEPTQVLPAGPEIPEGPEDEPAVLPEEFPEDDGPAELPAETPEEPVELPAEEPPAEEPPAEEPPMTEVPVQELEEPAEAEPAYPLEEIASAEEQPARNDGPDSL